MGKRVAIFSDFDGTITEVSASELVLERFAQGDWRSRDRRYYSGEITLKECAREQFSMIKGSKEEIVDFVHQEVPLRKGFKDFACFCQERGFKLKITSEGLDVVIEAVLKREGLDCLELFCDRAIFTADGLTVEFPYAGKSCRCNAGNCKRAQLIESRKEFETIVFIGDGASDFCPAAEADILFARRKLAEYCQAEGMDYLKYDNFHEVIASLENLLV